tara:strand:- start:3014 stop:3388 length:375 start_codon:yes stop_codon:yes gene_type:complete
MAQVNFTSTITASGLTSDTVSSTVLNEKTVTQGGISRTNVTAVVGAPATVIAHADHAAGSYVYLKNAGALNLFIKIEATASGTVYDMYLIPGDWALFPWAADTSDIRVYASAGTGCLLEYGVFE